ncbi:hypothetical protein L9F63_016286, partial [Diploptera punctata]
MAAQENHPSDEDSPSFNTFQNNTDKNIQELTMDVLTSVVDYVVTIQVENKKISNIPSRENQLHLDSTQEVTKPLYKTEDYNTAGIKFNPPGLY